MPPFDSLKEEEVWDLVHYVQSLRAEAHEVELMAAGLQDRDRESARARIWTSISQPAREGKIDKALMQKPAREELTATTVLPKR
jgi:hypothetical protein